MKNILVILTFFGFITVANASPVSKASPISKAQATKELIKIETSINNCFSNFNDYNCYFNAEDQYSSLLSQVRKAYKQNVNDKLWLAINISHNKLMDDCRSSELVNDKQIHFQMYMSCKVNLLNSLTYTAIRLHIK